MDNVEIARTLEEVADILEIQNANQFRIRAYRNAVRTVETQTTPLARWVAEGRPLTGLPGIGKEMANHIKEMIETGTLGYRDELLAEVPRSVLALMRLPAVGPKKAKRLHDELGVTSAEELEEAGKAGRIAALSGFGAKTQERILAGLAEHKERGNRHLLADAERFLEPLLAYLRESPGLDCLEVAGSYRRRKETIGDIDLLATVTPPDTPAALIERFLAYPQIAEVQMGGDTRATVVLGSGLQVDLRAVGPECYGAALVYFTGSKEHNVALRRRAVEQGLRISEYGVYRMAADEAVGEPIAGRDEVEVYATVGLAWIPPELREDRGEIAAAAKGSLPRLIERADLRGDLHMHSTWSDGRNTLEEMVEACIARGYEYMAISDHGKALPMVQGLDAYRLRLQWHEIDGIRERHPEIRLLRAMEVDILADGALDLEDEMLAGLDLVIASVHMRQELPPDEQTERILKALRHPAVKILGHPTGRNLNRRKPMAYDLDAVLIEAARLGVAVELNSSPHRLDLKDDHLRRAKELGCKIVIDTDAHRTVELDQMRWGLDQARRAGLTPADVLNTRPIDQLLAGLRRSV
jgi:DNA polymerase (family X)